MTAAQIVQTSTEHFRQNGFLAILNSRMNMLKNRRTAGQRLETAVVAATAFRSVNVDDHVANLASSAIEPRMKLAVQNQPAPIPVPTKMPTRSRSLDLSSTW